MAPVRRRAKLRIRMIDPQDVLYLDIGPSPRMLLRDPEDTWLRSWARRWPTEGAELMEALPEYSFAWAIETFGEPLGPGRRTTTPQEERE